MHMCMHMGMCMCMHMCMCMCMHMYWLAPVLEITEFMTAVLVRSCLSATIDPRGGGGRGGLARPYVCLTRPLGGAL